MIPSIKAKKGSAIAYALVLMAAVLIILTAMIQFVVSQMKYSLTNRDREEAFQIAESGVNFYRWYLAHQTEGKTVLQVKQFWETGNPIAVGTSTCGRSGDYEVEYRDPSGSAIGKYCLEVTPPPAWSTIAIIKSTGWTYESPGVKRVVQVRLRRPAWSEYMIFSNDMFRLSAGTRIYGKMYSATGIHFDGVAYNTVSSEQQQYHDEDYDANEPGVWTSWSNEYNTTLGSPVFTVGKSFPVPRTKEFSTVVGNFTLMKQEANNHINGSLYFDGRGEGRRIILKTNGTFDSCTVNSYGMDSWQWLWDSDQGKYVWTNMEDGTYTISNYLKNTGNGTCSSCSGQCLSNYTIPNNGVIFVEDNVWLEGQISSKQVTIAAADTSGATSPSVYFGMNNVKYTNYDGRDIIGITAQNSIKFIHDSLSTIRIDGALLAKEGELGINYYGQAKTSATIYGSIASYKRMNFGYTDNTGYLDRYLYYDNNLMYEPPPYFPTDSKYLLDSWEEL
jgi:hypothetical protein